MNDNQTTTLRKFKSLITLYHECGEEYISTENPRLDDPTIEFEFARKGTIFTLHELDEPNPFDEQAHFELVSNKLKVYFCSIEGIKTCGWFEEVNEIDDNNASLNKKKPSEFFVLYRLKTGYAICDENKFLTRKEAEDHLVVLEKKFQEDGAYSFMIVQRLQSNSIKEEEKS